MPANNTNTRLVTYTGDDPELRKYIGWWDSTVFDYEEFEDEKILKPRCGFGYCIHRNVKDVFIKMPTDPYDGDTFTIMDITNINDDYITEHYRKDGKLPKERPVTNDLTLTTGRIYIDNSYDYKCFTKVIVDKITYNPGDVFELTPTCCYVYIFTFSKVLNAWTVKWVEKECGILSECGCSDQVKVIIRFHADGYDPETLAHEDVFIVERNQPFRKSYKNYEIYNFYSVDLARENGYNVVDVRSYVERLLNFNTHGMNDYDQRDYISIDDYFQHLKSAMNYYGEKHLVCTENTIDGDVVYSFPFETGYFGCFYDLVFNAAYIPKTEPANVFFSLYHNKATASRALNYYNFVVNKTYIFGNESFVYKTPKDSFRFDLYAQQIEDDSFDIVENYLCNHYRGSIYLHLYDENRQIKLPGLNHNSYNYILVNYINPLYFNYKAYRYVNTKKYSYNTLIKYNNISLENAKTVVNKKYNDLYFNSNYQSNVNATHNEKMLYMSDEAISLKMSENSIFLPHHTNSKQEQTSYSLLSENAGIRSITDILYYYGVYSCNDNEIEVKDSLDIARHNNFLFPLLEDNVFHINENYILNGDKKYIIDYAAIEKYKEFIDKYDVIFNKIYNFLEEYKDNAIVYDKLSYYFFNYYSIHFNQNYIQHTLSTDDCAEDVEIHASFSDDFKNNIPQELFEIENDEIEHTLLYEQHYQKKYHNLKNVNTRGQGYIGLIPNFYSCGAYNSNSNPVYHEDGYVIGFESYGSKELDQHRNVQTMSILWNNIYYAHNPYDDKSAVAADYGKIDAYNDWFYRLKLPYKMNYNPFAATDNELYSMLLPSREDAITVDVNQGFVITPFVCLYDAFFLFSYWSKNNEGYYDQTNRNLLSLYYLWKKNNKVFNEKLSVFKIEVLPKHVFSHPSKYIALEKQLYGSNDFKIFYDKTSEYTTDAYGSFHTIGSTQVWKCLDANYFLNVHHTIYNYYGGVFCEVPHGGPYPFDIFEIRDIVQFTAHNIVNTVHDKYIYYTEEANYYKKALNDYKVDNYQYTWEGKAFLEILYQENLARKSIYEEAKEYLRKIECIVGSVRPNAGDNNYKYKSLVLSSRIESDIREANKYYRLSISDPTQSEMIEYYKIHHTLPPCHFGTVKKLVYVDLVKIWTESFEKYDGYRYLWGGITKHFDTEREYRAYWLEEHRFIGTSPKEYDLADTDTYIFGLGHYLTLSDIRDPLTCGFGYYSDLIANYAVNFFGKDNIAADHGLYFIRRSGLCTYDVWWDLYQERQYIDVFEVDYETLELESQKDINEIINLEYQYEVINRFSGIIFELIDNKDMKVLIQTYGEHKSGKLYRIYFRGSEFSKNYYSYGSGYWYLGLKSDTYDTKKVMFYTDHTLNTAPDYITSKVQARNLDYYPKHYDTKFNNLYWSWETTSDIMPMKEYIACTYVHNLSANFIKIVPSIYPINYKIEVNKGDFDDFIDFYNNGLTVNKKLLRSIDCLIDKINDFLNSETVIEFIPTGDETIINIFWNGESGNPWWGYGSGSGSGSGYYY